MREKYCSANSIDPDSHIYRDDVYRDDAPDRNGSVGSKE